MREVSCRQGWSSGAMTSMVLAKMAPHFDLKVAIGGELAECFHSQGPGRKDERSLGLACYLRYYELEQWPQFHPVPLSHYIVAGAWGAHVLPETFSSAWNLKVCAKRLVFSAKADHAVVNRPQSLRVLEFPKYRPRPHRMRQDCRENRIGIKES